MANKIYDPKTKPKNGGVLKAGFNFSHPNYNYLGRHKEAEHLKKGHISASYGATGLHPEEVKRHMELKQKMEK